MSLLTAAKVSVVFIILVISLLLITVLVNWITARVSLSRHGQVAIASLNFMLVLVMGNNLLQLVFEDEGSDPNTTSDHSFVFSEDLKELNSTMMSFLGKEPFTLKAAIFVVMLNHVFDLVKFKPYDFCGDFATSVIILHVWYDDNLKRIVGTRPFVSSCCLVFVNKCILWSAVQEFRKKFPLESQSASQVVLKWARRCASGMKGTLPRLRRYFDDSFPQCFKQRLSSSSQTLDSGIIDNILTVRMVVELQPQEKPPLIAVNVYQDLQAPFSKCILIFLVQTGLILHYVYEMSGLMQIPLDADPDGNLHNDMKDIANASVLKWMLAVCIRSISTAGELGASFDEDSLRCWERAWARYETKGAEDEVEHRQDRNILPLSWHLYLRSFMDWWINGAMFTIIITTSPIMLAVEDPLDFVKDVTALFFILKLDDMEAPVEIPDDKPLWLRRTTKRNLCYV